MKIVDQRYIDPMSQRLITSAIFFPAGKSVANVAKKGEEIRLDKVSRIQSIQKKQRDARSKIIEQGLANRVALQQKVGTIIDVLA